MGDPLIDADPAHGIDNDDRQDDVSRRRRQARADEPAETPGHQDQGGDVPFAESQEHPSHAVDEARHGEKSDHDAERRQQQEEVGGHLGMRLDHDADVLQESISLRRRIFPHVSETKIQQDQEAEHEDPGIEARKLFAVLEESHQDGQIDDPEKEDRRLELFVDRQSRPLDRRAGHFADAHQIDGQGERGIINERDGKAAENHVPVRHAEKFGHDEAGDGHHRRHHEPAHGRRRLHGRGELPRHAVALHERNRESADHRGVGSAAAADHADGGGSEDGGLRDRVP